MSPKGNSSKDNKTRKMVLNHIHAYPGVSFVVIRDIFAIPDGTLRYHLNYLERKKEIYSKLVDQERCFFPNVGVILDKKRSGPVVRGFRLTKTQNKILTMIKQHPGINQKDLILRTRTKRVTLVYNLNKLVDAELVRKVKDGRNVCYFHVTEEEIRQELLKKLLKKLIKGEISEAKFTKLKKRLE